MTQTTRERLFCCDRHGLETVYVVSRAVEENCSVCTKKMEEAGYVESHAKEDKPSK